MRFNTSLVTWRPDAIVTISSGIQRSGSSPLNSWYAHRSFQEEQEAAGVALSKKPTTTPGTNRGELSDDRMWNRLLYLFLWFLGAISRQVQVQVQTYISILAGTLMRVMSVTVSTTIQRPQAGGFHKGRAVSYCSASINLYANFTPYSWKHNS